jgi:phytoene/squalene synthetase
VTPIDFYQKHLDQVSRSFALCIGRLDTPLRRWVSLTYLVCRILDTVEDARWRRLSEQMKTFEEFNKFLMAADQVPQMGNWSANFPEGLPEGEIELLKEAQTIFKDLHELPAPIRGSIQSLVASMSAGMKYFAERKASGALRLSGLAEVNQYCFFVAGIVGETLANLLHAVDSRVPLSSSLLRDSHHFGLFLQKVNLLKDQFKDENEGRFLIPERAAVFASLGADAEGAIRYVETIPLEQNSYRIFCLWSLFLGLATLPLLQTQTEQVFEPKLSRDMTLTLLEEIASRASDSQWVRQTFNELFETAGLKSEPVRVSSSLASAPTWFSEAYRGQLVPNDLAALGVF